MSGILRDNNGVLLPVRMDERVEMLSREGNAVVAVVDEAGEVSVKGESVTTVDMMPRWSTVVLIKGVNRLGT